MKTQKIQHNKENNLKKIQITKHKKTHITEEEENNTEITILWCSTMFFNALESLVT